MLYVLVDSGLAGNFISSFLISTLSISVFNLASPVFVRVFDDHPVSNVPVTRPLKR